MGKNDLLPRAGTAYMRTRAKFNLCNVMRDLGLHYSAALNFFPFQAARAKKCIGLLLNSLRLSKSILRFYLEHAWPVLEWSHYQRNPIRYSCPQHRSQLGMKMQSHLSLIGSSKSVILVNPNLWCVGTIWWVRLPASGAKAVDSSSNVQCSQFIQLCIDESINPQALTGLWRNALRVLWPTPIYDFHLHVPNIP